MDARREIAYKKKERLSKNTCCCKYKNQQRNTCFLEVTDEKSRDERKVMPRLIEHILKRKDNKGQKEFHRLAKKQ